MRILTRRFFSLKLELADALEGVADEGWNFVFYPNYVNDADSEEFSIPSDQRPDFDSHVFSSVELVGSRHGLICLCYTPNSFKMWNPTTKESRDIPDPTISFDKHNIILYAFGYGPSGDYYNLVRCGCQNISKNCIIEVFSLKVGSWTRIERKVGTYLDGALHWEVARGVEPYISRSFIFLNLGGEKYVFGEILVPNVANKSIVFHTLGIKEGYLTMLSDENPDKLGIWVMKEYGVRESWSKIALLNLSDFKYYLYVKPVCFAKNGEIILNIDGLIILVYSMKLKSSRHLNNKHGAPNLTCALYVESNLT